MRHEMAKVKRHRSIGIRKMEAKKNAKDTEAERKMKTWKMYDIKDDDAETCSNASNDGIPTAKKSCDLTLDEPLDRGQLEIWGIDLAQAEYIQGLAERQRAHEEVLNEIWHNGKGFRVSGAFAKANKWIPETIAMDPTTWLFRGQATKDEKRIMPEDRSLLPYWSQLTYDEQNAARRDDGLRKIAMGRMHDILLDKWTEMKAQYRGEEARFKTPSEEQAYYDSLSQASTEMLKGATQVLHFSPSFQGIEAFANMVSGLVAREHQKETLMQMRALAPQEPQDCPSESETEEDKRKVVEEKELVDRKRELPWIRRQKDPDVLELGMPELEFVELEKKFVMGLQLEDKELAIVNELRGYKYEYPVTSPHESLGTHHKARASTDLPTDANLKLASKVKPILASPPPVPPRSGFVVNPEGGLQLAADWKAVLQDFESKEEAGIGSVQRGRSREVKRIFSSEKERMLSRETSLFNRAKASSHPPAFPIGTTPKRGRSSSPKRGMPQVKPAPAILFVPKGPQKPPPPPSPSPSQDHQPR